MYEVFFNDCQLSLMYEMNNSFKHNIEKSVDIERVADFFTLLSAIEAGQYRAGEIISCRLRPELEKMISERVTTIRAAGGLVSDCNGRFLFIRRFNRWDLPKGGIEKHESAREAAVREVQEECGLDQLEIVGELPPTFHLYRSRHLPAGNNWILKNTSWFEMRHHGDGLVTPQTDEDIEEVRWFEAAGLSEVMASTYAGLKKMLGSFFGSARAGA